MKKNVVPRGTCLKPDDNAWFEALAGREIERIPITAWDAKDNALWRTLPNAFPSTRRRLLMQLLAKCDVPLQLVEMIGRELDVSDAPRARVKDIAKFREAARYSARNPDASLAEIAVAIGMAKENKTTVAGWKSQPEFIKIVSDEQILFKLEQARAAIASGDEEAARPFRDATGIYFSEDDPTEA